MWNRSSVGRTPKHGVQTRELYFNQSDITIKASEVAGSSPAGFLLKTTQATGEGG